MSWKTWVVPVLIGSRENLYAEGPGLPPSEPARMANAQFKLDQLVESTMEQIHHAEMSGERIRHIVLGRDFYKQFTHQNIERSFSFGWPHDDQFRPRVHPSYLSFIFMGCTVHCIPWMEGIVVLPALDKERSPIVTGLGAWAYHGAGGPFGAAPEMMSLPAELYGDAKAIIDGLRAAFKHWAERPNERMEVFRRPNWWKRMWS